MRSFLARLGSTCIAAALAVMPLRAIATVDIVEITISDIQAGLAAGSFTALDLVQASLARINQYEPYYNAFTSFNPNALADAAALDLEYSTNGPRSSLHGVPIVIKEAMDVAGLPSTVGWAPLSSQVGGIDLFPEHDAPVVKRLRDAGAIILGKTNIPAFSASGTSASTSWDGNTYNAYDPTLAPGASSSGTATAVAASFGVVGTAEETGGSIQNPAGAQSLVGVKPTFGLVPNAGVAPLSANTRDVVGPHARTVRDAAITLDVMAGYTIEDPKTLLSVGNLPDGGYTSLLSETALVGSRFGTFGQGFKNVTLTAETQSLYDVSLATILAEGAMLVDDPFSGTDFTSLIGAMTAVFTEFSALPYEFNKYLAALGPSAAINSIDELVATTGHDPFAPGEILEFIGTFFPFNAANPEFAPDLSSFFEARVELLGLFDEIMDLNDLDGLVFPQTYKPTPLLLSGEQIGETTVSEINLLGTPGVTVSGGYYADGTPFSLIFLGELWSEAELLAYAYDFEQATLFRQAPTLVPLPPALWLMGSAIGFIALGRRRGREPLVA